MRRRLKAPQTADIDMTPMLDIVFILLIFFIVTATFLQEKGIGMIPPQTNDNDEINDPTPTILVQVDQRNFVYVNGQITDVERVTAAVQRWIVENGGKSAVVLQPHIDATHGVVTRVYDGAATAGAAVIIRKPEG